ncbi:MAG: hypothetical protein RTU30_05185 [Candidatus Thorarchaeota archaeon]
MSEEQDDVDTEKEERTSSEVVETTRPLTLMQELKESLQARRKKEPKEDSYTGFPESSEQTKSFCDLMDELVEIVDGQLSDIPLTEQLHEEVEKKKQRSQMRTRGDAITQSTGVRCKLHQRLVIYDHEELLWSHSDDGSPCEQMDALPHPDGELSGEISTLSLRSMLHRVITRSSVQSLVDSWLEIFESAEDFNLLAEKWSLVLIAASLTEELKIEYETIGGRIKKLMREFANKMLLLSALDLIEQEPEIRLPSGSETSLLRSVDGILNRLLTTAAIATTSEPYGSVLIELKMSKAFKARIPKRIVREKWVSNFLAEVKREYDLGLLDYDSLREETVGDDSVLEQLFKLTRNAVVFQDLTKAYEESIKQDTLNCILRKLFQMDEESSLERKLGYIGVIGIAIERNVANEYGFSYELLTL